MSDATSNDNPVSTPSLSMGGVIRRTFAVLAANLLPFLVIAFVLTLPMLLYNFLTGGGAAVDPVAPGASYFIGLLLSMVITYASMGAVVYGTVAHLRGQPSSLGICITRGLSVVITVVLVGIVVTLLLTLGMIALVIPGLMVLAITAVAVPAAVVERPGIWGSVKRSAELTKGNRWRVFGLLMIFYLGITAIGWGLTFAGLPLMAPDGTALAMILLYLWGGVTTALFGVFGAVLYHDLRIAKEGVNTEQIAAVFD